MKLHNVLLALATLLPAAGAQARTFPFLRCGQVGGNRQLSVDTSNTGLIGTLDRRALTDGQYSQDIVTFEHGDAHDADYLSLEIRRVNGRYIGVLVEPAKKGPAAYQETVFSCAEIQMGAASSNGG